MPMTEEDRKLTVTEVQPCGVCFRCGWIFRRGLTMICFALMFLSFATRVDGNRSRLPFGHVERIPPRENCTTGEECAGQRAQVMRMREHRLAIIKREIFAKLGLESKPNVTQDIPRETIDKVVRKAIDRDDERTEGDFPDNYFADVSKIVSFAEEAAVQNNNTEDGVQFILHKERRQERLRVVNANLYLLVRYRKRPKVKGSKHTSKRVRIKILNAPLHKKAPDLLTTLDVDVRHTRWQNLILPTSVIQEVLDSDDNVLRLRIQCEDCGSDVSPVLVKRKPRNSQKRGRRKSRRGSRKSRRNSRRAAPALKGLHLRRVGGNKDDADGDAEGPANSRDNHRFGDIRDQIKSKKKIHKRRPFLVIHTRAGAHSEAPLKKKRSIKCNQQGVGACTKRPFFVDFAEFGWNDWILFPQGYNANYCDGQCKNLLLPSSLNAHHSTILDSFMSTFHVAKGAPENDGSHCCSNTLYSPLSILFLDEFNNLVKADLPNMIVEECGCA